MDGTRLTFGFEGIYQGTAVLYDHQTGSLWMHLTGACFEGEYAGTTLDRIPAGRHTTWADWFGLHPETDVLKPDPRFSGRSGDQGYFPVDGSRSGSPYFPDTFGRTMGVRDDRLEPHALLYGVVVGTAARAYPFDALAHEPVVEERIGDVDATIWFDPGSRSAAAFDRRVGTRVLSFQAGPQGIRDTTTQSRWTMDGVCVGGALEGSTLTPLFGLMSEWYGWYANHTDTTVFVP